MSIKACLSGKGLFNKHSGIAFFVGVTGFVFSFLQAKKQINVMLIIHIYFHDIVLIGLIISFYEWQNKVTLFSHM